MIVLVDYDNCKRERRSRSVHDCEVEISLLLDRIAEVSMLIGPRQRVVDVRFYGGWTDLIGEQTATGYTLERALLGVRKRIRGTSFRTHLVFAPIRCPEYRINGMYRRDGSTGSQKMVDTLLAVDVLELSELDEDIVIMTSDEDIFPACIVAARKARRGVTIINRPAISSWSNGSHLLALKIPQFELGW